MDENLVVGKLTKTRAVLPKSKYHLSSAGMKHSTPTFQSKSWSSRLDDSTGSVEHLRDATLMGRDKTTELSLEQLIHLRAGNSTSKILQSSSVKLQPIQETAVSDSFVEISGTKGESVQNSERRAGVDNLTQNVTENVTRPKIDLTHHAESDLEEALSRKVAEIEYMSQLLQKKDEMIDNLQDNMEECQAGLDELRKIEEAIKKIQGDGIQVLSLSERLFLMQHTNVGKSFSLTSDTEPDGSNERELGRRLEVLEFQLKQRVSASRCPSRRRICWRV